MWAALAAIACLYLILTKQTGHPPPITLVPLVLAAWLVGHGFIWGAQRLADQGRSDALPTSIGGRSWPIGLRLALVATGIPALIGIAQVAGTVMLRQWYPYNDFSLWVTMLAVCLAHSASFAGLLMRKRWARALTAMLSVGWALLLVMQVVEQVIGVAALDAGGVLIAAGLIVLLVLFAAYLARSRQVTSFLVR